MQGFSSDGVRWCADASSARSRCSTRAFEYWAGLQGGGKIEDFEVVLLAPHGGDLAGYALLRGSAEQLNALRDDDEFQRQNTRADQIVERLGVVDAVLGEGIGQVMTVYTEEIQALD